MSKKYFKLIVLINTFFLFYTFGIFFEKSQVSPGSGYYGGFFAWTFLPAFFFFMIFYGCYSYLKTNRIFLPNLFLLIFLAVYYYVIFYLGLLSSKAVIGIDFSFFTKCFSFVGISVFCSIIVKLILWVKSKKTKDDSSYL